MINHHHIKKAAKHLSIIYVLVFIIASVIGAHFSIKGAVKPISRQPNGVFENVEFLSLDKDAINISAWYMPATSKKTALLVHGWGGNRSTMIDLADYLQQNGINVLSLDLRGGTGKNTYGQHEAGDIEGGIEWLRQERGIHGKDIVLIGNSMGGAASIIYASKNSVGGLVLISSVYNINHTKMHFANEFTYFVPYIYAKSVAFFERLVYKISPINPADVMVNVQNPIFIIHGNADDKANITDMYEAVQKVPQNLVLNEIVIQQGGHTAFFDDIMRQRALSEQITLYIKDLP